MARDKDGARKGKMNLVKLHCNLRNFQHQSYGQNQQSKTPYTSCPPDQSLGQWAGNGLKRENNTRI